MAAFPQVLRTRNPESARFRTKFFRLPLLAFLCLCPGLSLPRSALAGPDKEAKGDAPKSSKSADIVFVVDATGSMEAHIKNLRESLPKFSASLADSRMDTRFAVTIFRDRVDNVGNKPEDPFSLKVGENVFSKNAADFAKLLAEVKAEGGGDFPESAFDALAFSATLPFRKEARKVLILLTDAPPRVPDKEIRDEMHLAKLLQERGIDQLHVFHDLEPERYRKLQTVLGKGRGRAVSLFPGGIEAMQRSLNEMAQDVAGFDPVLAGKGPAAIGRAEKLDMVFVVDTTASMGPDLGLLRNHIKRVTSTLAGSKVDFRIGIVSFKDRMQDAAGFGEPRSHQFDDMEFTADPDALVRELNKLRAEGGGDEPESSYDALDFASRRSFRKEARKVLVLVTDAPPRVPDRDVKDEATLVKSLKARGIEQVHFLIRDGLPRYTALSERLERGRIINLARGDDFADGLEAVTRASAGIDEGVIVAGERIGGRVDIVFVVDTTGSMGADLATLRDSMDGFVKTLRDRKTDFQIGLVEFKDRMDPFDSRAVRFAGKEFTTDLAALTGEIGNLRADGGGDDPESGLDALEFASRRPFRVGAARVLVLLTDAAPRLPDRDMKDHEQVARLFKERGVDQFHMIVRGNGEQYSKLSKLHGKGRVVNVGLGASFRDGMQSIAADASSGVAVAVGKEEKEPGKEKGIDEKLGDKIDLVFVVDVTGSMDAPLRHLRDHIGQFTRPFQDARKDFRVSIVTFTDRVDELPPNNEHRAIKFAEGSEFSRDSEELGRELGKLNALGGGDDPESGLDALEFASRREFRKDARKVFVLVTDAGPRLPDKEMRDEQQAAQLLKDRGVDTLHLLIGAKAEPYEKLAKLLPHPGRVLDINRGGGEGFKASLEEIARSTLSGDKLADKKLPIAGSKVDLVFLIDTTGSMSDFAGALQRPAEQIIARLHKEKVDVRFSLISFRDRHPGDGNAPEDHKIIQIDGKEFSSSVEELRRAIGTLRADQGGDAPESSLDAMAFAAKRDFRFDALKVLVLITDEGPKVPDKDMKDENDVLRIFKDKGIHQLHLIVGNNADRYFTLQRLMGKDGKVAGKTARINDRGADLFGKTLDEMSVAMLDQLRTEGRIRLSDRPLPPLQLAKNEKEQGMVDVMIVLDVTASMGAEIAMIRDYAPRILSKLQDLNLDVRLGLTYYRDRVDKTGNVPEDSKALLFGGEEFTRNLEDFRREVGNLKARDGGDPEDSALDAIEYASRRSFRKGAYKVLIVVTDAPPRVPDRDIKDEIQLGEMLRERGINQIHLLLKTEPHRYITLQRFLTSDGSQAGLQFDLGSPGRSDRILERLMGSLSRSIASETRRGLTSMAKGADRK